MIVIIMIRMQEFEHVILESALENVVNKFRRHITIKVEKTELVFIIILEISFHIPNHGNQFSSLFLQILFAPATETSPGDAAAAD